MEKSTSKKGVSFSSVFFLRRLWGENHDYNLDEVLMEIAYFKGEHYFMHTFCVPGPKALNCPQNDFLNLSNAVSILNMNNRQIGSWTFHSRYVQTVPEFFNLANGTTKLSLAVSTFKK